MRISINSHCAVRCSSCAQTGNSMVCFCSHKDEFSIVPVLVGALSENKELEYGKLLSKYLADPSNLFIISSDFCHWGM